MPKSDQKERPFYLSYEKLDVHLTPLKSNKDWWKTSKFTLLPILTLTTIHTLFKCDDSDKAFSKPSVLRAQKMIHTVVQVKEHMSVITCGRAQAIKIQKESPF